MWASGRSSARQVAQALPARVGKFFLFHGPGGSQGMRWHGRMGLACQAGPWLQRSVTAPRRCALPRPNYSLQIYRIPGGLLALPFMGIQ